MTIKRLATPIDLGKELQVVKTSVAAASTEIYEFSMDAEAVLISLYVGSTSGDVDVSVFTEGATGNQTEVITFPTVSATTAEMLLRKSASILRKVRVQVTTTDAASFEVRARGVSAGAASVQIAGASSIQVTRTAVTTSPSILITSTLLDRQGILIENISDLTAPIGTLYIAETLAKATTSAGHPIRPGGNFSVDVKAGGELYAVATDNIAVSIIESGELA